MTCIEKLKLEHPDKVDKDYQHGCPSAYGYLPDPGSAFDYCTQNACEKCWNREIPETKEKPEVNKPRILDSGNRREFESGAVRDIQEGKGRCDLLPLDVVGRYARDIVLTGISLFQENGNVEQTHRWAGYYVDKT